jgi:hypothetical protein
VLVIRNKGWANVHSFFIDTKKETVMSINDDMPCFGGVPIDVRVSRGRLRCVPPYSDNELEFTQIEGRLIFVSKIKWHGFPYWCIELKDDINTYHLLFFLKSGMFVYLLRCLFGRKVENLSIEVGPLSDGSVQMIVEGYGKRLEPASIDLPPIKRKRKKKGKPYFCDYSERLKAVQKIVDEMNIQPTRTHKG